MCTANCSIVVAKSVDKNRAKWFAHRSTVDWCEAHKHASAGEQGHQNDRWNQVSLTSAVPIRILLIICFLAFTRMINSQNYIANIGGKPLIIANKTNAQGGNSNTGGQGLVLQASNSSNGTFILNSQGQQLKVQGNILTQVKLWNDEHCAMW